MDEITIDVLKAFAASRRKTAKLDSAIKKTARRRKTTPDAVRRALLADAGKDADAILDYHISRALAEWRDLEQSRCGDDVEFESGEDVRRSFKITVNLDISARVALGVIARHRPQLLGDDLSEKVSGALGELCEKSPARLLACRWALQRVKCAKDDAGRFGIVVAPDLLAMPDESAPLGFVTLADLRARQAAADKADDAATGRGGVK